MELTPINMFADVILAKAKNKQLAKEGKPQLKIPFLPVAYDNKSILWWHVPEFLEQNTQNKTVEELSSRTFWVTRRRQMEKYFDDEILELIEDKFRSDLWTRKGESSDKLGYIPEDDRAQLFDEMKYLAGHSCNGRYGFHAAGLYLDFERFKKLFNKPVKEVMRVVDNNMFLGDMATFYLASLENKEPKEKCEMLKKEYLRAYKLACQQGVHLRSTLHPQEKFSLAFLDNRDKKMDYEIYLQDHIQIMNKFDRTKKM